MPTSLIGLVGFRCCGKSTLREILRRLGYPVFDTNSVRTGDPDANQIPLDEILKRYGGGNSYLLFIKEALRDFLCQHSGVVFIDSLKVATDPDVLRDIVPDVRVLVWYLHASLETRHKRYIQRDINTGRRSEDLKEHDQALERFGILQLIKSASEVINMELALPEVETQVRLAVERSSSLKLRG